MIKLAPAYISVYLKELMAPLQATARLRIRCMLREDPVDPNWGKPNAVHFPNHQLTLIRSGKGTYWVNGQEASLKPGRVVFVSSRSYVAYEQDSADPPSIIRLYFDVVSLRDGEQVHPPKPGLCFAVVTPQRIDRFTHQFEQLFEYWQQCPEPMAEAASASLLHMIILALRDECLHTESTPKDPCMEQIRLLLESEPAANWSISDLATRFNLSDSQLSRRFQRYTGMPPKRFQLLSRMRYARRALYDQELAVQEVADLLGYSDAFAFSRQFKKIWGIPPSKVRRQRVLNGRAI